MQELSSIKMSLPFHNIPLHVDNLTTFHESNQEFPKQAKSFDYESNNDDKSPQPNYISTSKQQMPA